MLQPVPQPYDLAPQPPRHLSPEAKRWWFAVVDGYTLAAHELLLLQSAAESWDELQAAREVVAAEGMTFRDHNDCIRPHPAVAIARDAKTSFNRTLRQLNLDVETPSGS